MHSYQCRPTAHLEFHYREIWSRVLQQFFPFFFRCFAGSVNLIRARVQLAPVGPSWTGPWAGKKKEREPACPSCLHGNRMGDNAEEYSAPASA